MQVLYMKVVLILLNNCRDGGKDTAVILVKQGEGKAALLSLY